MIYTIHRLHALAGLPRYATLYTEQTLIYKDHQSQGHNIIAFDSHVNDQTV
jgi:hypothetical protein